MLLVLLPLLAFAADATSERCSAPISFNLPTFSIDIEFPVSMTPTTIHFDGEVMAGYGYFYTFTPQSDTILTINTCNHLTNMPVDILIFKECNNNEVSQVLAASTDDQECVNTVHSSYLDYGVNAGERYLMMIKKRNDASSGQVHLDVMPRFLNGNMQCKTATTITSLPFAVTEYIDTSYVSSPKCFTTARSGPTNTAWFTLVGDGRSLIIHTCNSYNTIDTQIAVVDTLVGEGCDGSECVSFNQDRCGKTNLGSLVKLDTAQGRKYYIGVGAENKKAGSFLLKIDYLNETINSECSRALPIGTIPFTFTKNVPDVWPHTLSPCDLRDTRGFYFHFQGTGKEMVLSTCKSITADGTTNGMFVDIVKDCNSNQCLNNDANTFYCGNDAFVKYKFEKGTTYYIRVGSTLPNVQLTFDMYEKTEDHATCETALELVSPDYFSDNVMLQNVQVSSHGCKSKQLKDQGSWFKLVRQNSNDEFENYMIKAMNAHMDQVGTIEAPMACNLFNCDGEDEGSMTVTLSTSIPQQLIFTYLSSDVVNRTFLFTQIVREDPKPHETCENALDVVLPFSRIETLGSQPQRQICQSGSHPANYYRFKPPTNGDYIVTTCFAKTIVNTAVEITTGCSPSGTCVGLNLDGDGCMSSAAQLRSTLQKDRDYIAAIFREDTISVSTVYQYRVAIFSAETPANSKCTTPTVIPDDATLHVETIVNHFDAFTHIESLQMKGNYFKLKPKHQTKVYVSTCSSETTENSVLVRTKTCDMSVVSGQTVSVIPEYDEFALSSRAKCGLHGTFLEFELEQNEETLIFVGVESLTNDAYINVEFVMFSDSPSEGGSNGAQTFWIIWGVFLYIYALVILAVVAALIVLKVVKQRTYSQF